MTPSTLDLVLALAAAQACAAAEGGIALQSLTAASTSIRRRLARNTAWA